MNKKILKITCFILFIIFINPARADNDIKAEKVSQTELKPWDYWKISGEDGYQTDTYVVSDKKEKPLVIMVPGSKCIPLFLVKRQNGKKRLLSTLIFQDAVNNVPSKVHFAAVERHGIKSFTDVPEKFPPCTETYGGFTKESRVKDVVNAVRAFSREKWVKEIFLVGHSEGADVVSGVAKYLGNKGLEKNKVKVIGFLSSGGPTQFFDHIEEERLSGNHEGAKEVFDELLSFTGGKPSAEYRGFPAKRYQTFAIDSTPLDDLKDLSIPVFIAHGTADRNSPIVSDDLLAAELLRQNKDRKVKYLMLKDLDHGYWLDENNWYGDLVFNKFLEWAMNINRNREVEFWKK